MKESSQNKQQQATLAYQELLQSVQTLILSTLDEQSNPYTSYAPFVIDADQNFYILRSELVEDTHHLLNTGKTHILLIEDEAKTPQIFARRRLSFSCTVTEIPRSDETWNQMIQQLENRFGETVSMIASLTDFHLFKLTPQKGRFVMGFGSAYDLKSDHLDQLVPVQMGKNP